jgi:hypothetical protein
MKVATPSRMVKKVVRRLHYSEEYCYGFRVGLDWKPLTSRDRNVGFADKPLNSGFKSSLHRTGDVPWESALLRLSSRAARRSAGISALRRLGRRNGTRSGGYSKFQILMRIPTRVGKQALSVQKIYRSGQIPYDRGFRSNSVSPRPLLVPCRRSPCQLRPRWLRGAGFFRH